MTWSAHSGLITVEKVRSWCVNSYIYIKASNSGQLTKGLITFGTEKKSRGRIRSLLRSPARWPSPTTVFVHNIIMRYIQRVRFFRPYPPFNRSRPASHRLFITPCVYDDVKSLNLLMPQRRAELLYFFIQL